jgi:hypothetical protein
MISVIRVVLIERPPTLFPVGGVVVAALPAQILSRDPFS